MTRTQHFEVTYAETEKHRQACNLHHQSSENSTTRCAYYNIPKPNYTTPVVLQPVRQNKRNSEMRNRYKPLIYLPTKKWSSKKTREKCKMPGRISGVQTCFGSEEQLTWRRKGKEIDGEDWTPLDYQGRSETEVDFRSPCSDQLSSFSDYEFLKILKCNLRRALVNCRLLRAARILRIWNPNHEKYKPFILTFHPFI